MVQYTPPSVRIDIGRRVHVVLGRLLNNTSIIMDKFPLTVDVSTFLLLQFKLNINYIRNA